MPPVDVAARIRSPRARPAARPRRRVLVLRAWIFDRTRRRALAPRAIRDGRTRERSNSRFRARDRRAKVSNRRARARYDSALGWRKII